MISSIDKTNIIKRLMKHSVIDWNTGCFLWIGYTTRTGHGMTSINGDIHLVHTLSAYVFKNFDLHGILQVNHKRHCLNKNCWSPSHLYIGDQSQNCRDIVACGRNKNAAKTHCKHGHEFTPENTHIRSNGKRECRQCMNSRARSYRN